MPVEACVFACDADVLAREPATNHLHFVKLRSANTSHVVVPNGLWPVHGEHPATPRVRLDLPQNRTEPSPFQAKLQPSDAREQAPDHTVTKSLSKCSPFAVTE
jgi:hypothetical protein